MSHSADGPPVSRWSDAEREVKLAEYGHAQDMLKHYDSLNWQIGSILIGANAVLLGLVANILPVATQKAGWWSLLIAGGVALFSLVLLGAWRIWFSRHRNLYNLRNETLQRLELDLGMYHFLRVAEAAKNLALEGSENDRALEKEPARIAAALRPARSYAYGRGDARFVPFWPGLGLGGFSGDLLSLVLVVVLPVLEFGTLAAVIWALRH